MFGSVIVKYNRLPTSLRNSVGSERVGLSSLLILTLSSNGVSKGRASVRRAEDSKSLTYFRCDKLIPSLVQELQVQENM